MFFENTTDIPKIAAHTSCTIFVLPPNMQPKFPHALILEPDTSKKTTTITVEQVREFSAHAQNRETSDRFFIVRPADAMNEAAQNAFLKTIEESHDFCHFVLITDSPSSLLATIHSRAQTFQPKITNHLSTPPKAKLKILNLAKQLISATPTQLPTIATEIAKNKTQPRQLALEVTSVAIELLYKSYLQTNNPKFLTKLPNFLQLHESLTKNGHIKLHLVADLC